MPESQVLDRYFASRNSSQKVHHVLWRFVRKVHHHPYENMVENFSRIVICLCKYLILNIEKLLELNSAIAIRIGDNCLCAYQMC